jgi:hypothetical protein
MGAIKLEMMIEGGVPTFVKRDGNVKAEDLMKVKGIGQKPHWKRWMA